MTDRNAMIEKLKNGTPLDREEEVYLQQNPLTDVEAFSMVEENPEKVAEYAHYHDLREAVKEGNLTEQQLQGLVDTLFSGGQNQDQFINASSLYTTLKGKLYDDYRANTARLIDQERKNGTFVNSQYTVEYGDKPVCHHQLESVSDKGRTVLQQQTFDYTDEFRSGMLEPSIIDYAQRSPMMGSSVKPNDNNPETSNYQTYSQNNNILNIKNIDPTYADNIASGMQQIPPVVYEQQQALAMNNQTMVVVPEMVKARSGFAGALLLAALVGFIIGFGICIALLLV